MANLPKTIDLDRLDGFLMDLDGVITRTAAVHAKAWKQLFDTLLQNRAQQTGQAMQPFDLKTDYTTYVDGKPRHDGIRSFLASRGIDLPEGCPSDAPGYETIYALGHVKQACFLRLIEDEGVEVYASSVAFIRRLQQCGLQVALVTSSKNSVATLRAAGIDALFDAMVDGNDREQLGLKGKPDPATFLEAAKRLSVPAARAAVVEDSIAGVQAGQAGHFAYVIGVDRARQAEQLKRNGADLVVQDLSEIVLIERGEVGHECG